MKDSVDHSSTMKMRKQLKIFIKLKSINDTVWQSKKGRQQTEKDIELLLNRLQLLKKEETLMHKKLEETKSRTQIVVDKKYNNQMLHELKKSTKRGDDDKLRDAQKSNFLQRCKQEEDRRMILQAVIQIKRGEYDEEKKIQFENKIMVENQKKQLIEKNHSKKIDVKEHMSQSRSNINKYWSSKIDRIQKKHDMQKIIIDNHSDKADNQQAQSKNEIIMGRLEQEELSLINKLQLSQEVQDQLSRRLDRAINLPHNEFKKIYAIDTDLRFETKVLKDKPRQTRLLHQSGQSASQLSIIRDNTDNQDQQQEVKQWLPQHEEETVDQLEEWKAKEQEKLKPIIRSKKNKSYMNNQAVGTDSPREQLEDSQQQEQSETKEVIITHEPLNFEDKQEIEQSEHQPSPSPSPQPSRKNELINQNQKEEDEDQKEEDQEEPVEQQEVSPPNEPLNEEQKQDQEKSQQLEQNEEEQ